MVVKCSDSIGLTKNLICNYSADILVEHRLILYPSVTSPFPQIPRIEDITWPHITWNSFPTAQITVYWLRHSTMWRMSLHLLFHTLDFPSPSVTPHSPHEIKNAPFFIFEKQI